jgi:hypothetical protein
VSRIWWEWCISISSQTYNWKHPVLFLFWFRNCWCNDSDNIWILDTSTLSANPCQVWRLRCDRRSWTDKPWFTEDLSERLRRFESESAALSPSSQHQTNKQRETTDIQRSSIFWGKFRDMVWAQFSLVHPSSFLDVIERLVFAEMSFACSNDGFEKR